jgi:hypothetical protein
MQENPIKSNAWQQFVSTRTPVADEDIDTTFLEEREEKTASPHPAEESEHAGGSPWDEGEEAGEDDEFEGEGEGEHDSDSDSFGAQAAGEVGRSGRRRRRRRKKRRGNGSALQDGPPPPLTPQAHANPSFAAPAEEPERQSPRNPQPTAAPPSSLIGVTTELGEHSAGGQGKVRREEQGRTVPPRVSEQRISGDGMLIGWLVSFKEDSKGKAIELRSGRCFIGRGQLRNSDIVFGHDSVSTPHGMLVASESEGLSFQDLMSERGTYVLRNGGKVSEWSQILNSTSLSHGDRVRFGDYEVVVVLLPR